MKSFVYFCTFLMLIACGMAQAEEKTFVVGDNPFIPSTEDASLHSAHIKLETNWIFPPTPSLLKPLQELKELAALKIECGHPSNHGSVYFFNNFFYNSLQTLPCLESVRRLELHGASPCINQQCTDSFFYKLSCSFPDLKVLTLGRYFLDFKGDNKFQDYKRVHNNLHGIALLHNIEELYFYGAINDCEAADIVNLKKLRVLTLASCHLSEREAREILSIPTLEVLNLNETYFDPFENESYEGVCINTLEPAPLLTELSVKGDGFRRFIDMDLSGFAPHLHKLSLSLNFAQYAFDTIGRNQELKHLAIQESTFSTENIEQAQWTTMPTLLTLNFSGSNVKGFPFHSFAPNATALILASTNVGTKDVQTITQLLNLEELNLESTHITHGAIKRLGQLHSLRKLILKGNNLTGAALEALTQVESLELSGCEFSVADFNKLASLKQLRELKLYQLKNSNISPAMVESMQQELPDCIIEYRL